MKSRNCKKKLTGMLCAVLFLADMTNGKTIGYAAGLDKSECIQNEQDELLSEIAKQQIFSDESLSYVAQTTEGVSETEASKETNTKFETTAECESAEEAITEDESAEEESVEETITEGESAEETIAEEESAEETTAEEESTEEIKTANILAEKPVIKIDKTYLCVGKEIGIENPEGYKIKWYVDDTFVAEDQYTPTKDDYEKWIKAEAYLENTDESTDIESDDTNGDTDPVCSDSVYFSKLPVMYIDTGDDDPSPVKDKSVYIDAAMFIQNNEQVKSAVYDNAIQIKGRGNSTWNFSKKPYKIKLEKKTDLYGMGKNKHWVLLANYLDESLMRNTIAGNLSKELGLVNMQTVWVDVIINGNYVGNYQLCEHIRIGDSRVDIADWESEAEDVASAISEAVGLSKNGASELEDNMKEDLSWISSGKVTYGNTEYDIASYTDWNKDISGGYLFESSEEYDEISKFKTNNGLNIMINSPEYLCSNDDMMDYVQKYWNAFEDAYLSEDGYTQYNGENVHYSQMADFDSMIGYWLTMEIMGNRDASWKSRYAYMDRGGKLYFGPVWDFDWGCGSSAVGTEADGWKVTQLSRIQNFFAQFVDDPYFLQKAYEKYWEIRPYLESLICDGGILDEDYEYLYESGMRNSEKWFNQRGFEQDFQIFKKYMKERIAWLDEQFDTEESITKSVYTTTVSAHPYIKSDDKLVITLNGAEYTERGHRITPQADAETIVRINDDQIKRLQVYVNGLEYDTCTVKDGEAVFTVASSNLTEKEGTKNIISIIAKDNGGNTLYTNFVSVIVAEGAVCEVNRIIITGLDIPQAGKALDMTAVCTSAGIDTTEPDVTWTSEETNVSGIAKYNTSYTASMLIRAKTSAGYQLSKNAIVTVNGETAETAVNEDGSLTVKISFLTDKAKLLDITTPREIEIANGTALEAILLPQAVDIITEDKDITNAEVKWDIEAIEGYNQTNLNEQNFVINGNILCPDEIDSNGKSLSVIINVYVRAAEIISNVEITDLNCPEPEKIPDTTVKCNNTNIKNINVVWKQGEQLINNAADVEYNKTYTAHIIIEAGIGYQFADSTQVRINNDILTAVLNENGTLTTTKDFVSRKAKLLEIIPPDRIHIASGTNLRDIVLPQFVDITTEDKNITVSDVAWDLEHIENYNPAKLTDQDFEINGLLLCSEIDVSSMEAKVSVKVSAHYDIAFAGDVLLEDIPSNGMIPSGLWIADIKDSLYTGTKIKPDAHVYNSNKRLKVGQDYTISYKNNIRANDASNDSSAPTVVVKGKGNYTGKETALFKILPVSINDSSIMTEDITVAYNGKIQKRTPVVTFNGKKLSGGKDFTVSYPSHDPGNAYQTEGTYDILLTAKEGGNFTGTRTVKLTITNNTLISKAAVKKIPNQAYTGNAIMPPLTVTLKKATLIENQDYTVSYENNTDVGTATVILTGIGAYAGTKKITFKINGTPLKKVSVTGIEDKIYNGKEQTQNISVQANGIALKEGIDYEITYANIKNAGKATVTIKGINAYTGIAKKTFRIAPYNINENAGKQIKGLDNTITAKYVKGGSKPKLQLTFADEVLIEGIDYTLSYKNNKTVTSSGTKKPPCVTITGKGNFKGTYTKNFTIEGKSLDDTEYPVRLTVPDKGFVNKAGNYISKPTLTDVDGVKLSIGKDYESTLVYALADGTSLTKKSILPAGTDIMVTVTGKGAYSGKLTANYRISQNDFSKAKISITPQVYIGGEITLNEDSISVKFGKDTLLFGTDYVIAEESYSNNIKKGTAKVTIIGKGNYGGSKTVSFKITAKKLSWFWRN